ncbi:MAG: AbrB/MazE/SpoVT family DNA-binding domain-containing protein [Verrucomicrobiae bacterium]|nr:AbrB/MazE/SpoVT family DNA-binding domain-containing protein [Verrucomicrobiae bacterium]
MKASLVPIGNSRGIRIPKPLIELCGLDGEVEITLRDRSLIIQSPKKPRGGWDAAFAQMARKEDDSPVHGDISQSPWDVEEWEWK